MTEPAPSTPLHLLRDIALSALNAYDLPGGAALHLVNISENATYRVDAPDGRRWALRIHREGYHSRNAIASELAWLMDLRERGVVTTPKPVAGRDGEIIQLVTQQGLGTARHVVLTQWEAGAEPGMGENLIGPFEVLGEVTARMHLHAQSWQKPTWFTRHAWTFETALGEDAPHWGRWRDGMGVDAGKAELFGRTVKAIGHRLLRYGSEAQRFGLIHADLRLANLLVDGAAIKVLDFDDCGFGWFMYDAATPFSFHEHEPQVPELLDAWKAGYRKVAPLSKADEAEIPTFIILRRLLLVAWIGSHWDTDLAKSMGLAYTEGTVALCENYLAQFS